MVQLSGEIVYVKLIVVDIDSQDWVVVGQNVSIVFMDMDLIYV